MADNRHRPQPSSGGFSRPINRLRQGGSLRGANWGWTTETAPSTNLLPGIECIAPGFGREVVVSTAGILVGIPVRCALWFQGVGGDSLEDSPIAIAYGLDLADDLRSFGFEVAL